MPFEELDSKKVNYCAYEVMTLIENKWFNPREAYVIISHIKRIIDDVFKEHGVKVFIIEVKKDGFYDGK